MSYGSPARPKRQSPVKFELVVAGGLILLATTWDAWRGLGLWAGLAGSGGDVLWGIVAAAPPLGLIPLLEWPVAERIPGLRGMRRDINTVLVPLLGQVGAREALALSVLAGVSEELFFRGVLQREVGLGLASLIFGLCHAITLPYVVWATGVGAYLGWLAQWRGSLWAPMVAHAVIDWVGLWYIRHVSRPDLKTHPHWIDRGGDKTKALTRRAAP